MALSTAQRAELQQELASALRSSSPDTMRAVEVILPQAIDAFLLSPITPGQKDGLLDLLVLSGKTLVGLTITKAGMTSQIFGADSVAAVELDVDEKHVTLFLRQNTTRVWKQSMARGSGIVDKVHAFASTVMRITGLS